jgi:hypothetical protein
MGEGRPAAIAATVSHMAGDAQPSLGASPVGALSACPAPPNAGPPPLDLLSGLEPRWQAPGQRQPGQGRSPVGRRQWCLRGHSQGGREGGTAFAESSNQGLGPSFRNMRCTAQGSSKVFPAVSLPGPAPASGLVPPLQGHTINVRCVTWSPDSQRVASGSVDKTLRVWDVPSGASVATLEVRGLGWLCAGEGQCLAGSLRGPHRRCASVQQLWTDRMLSPALCHPSPAPVAQKVEHSVFHRGGVGSYPTRSNSSGQVTLSN